MTPQLGYVWADTRFEGTMSEPGQFTELSAGGDVRGATWGLAAAITRRFWSRDRRTAFGPVLGFHFGRANEAAARLELEAPQLQQVALRLQGNLQSRLTRGGVGGGVGLTMLGGLLEVRVLVGGEGVEVVVPELDGSTASTVPAFGATLGWRLRLPVTAGWLALAGAQCSRSKYLSTGGGLIACSSELGLEWRFGR